MMYSIYLTGIKKVLQKVDETENDDEIRMKFVPKEKLQKQKEEKESVFNE